MKRRFRRKPVRRVGSVSVAELQMQLATGRRARNVRGGDDLFDAADDRGKTP